MENDCYSFGVITGAYSCGFSNNDGEKLRLSFSYQVEINQLLTGPVQSLFDNVITQTIRLKNINEALFYEELEILGLKGRMFVLLSIIKVADLSVK